VPDVPYLKIAAVLDGKGWLTLFALNRELSQEMRLEVTARGFNGLAPQAATTLHDADLFSINSKESPERIVPRALEGVSVSGDRVMATLPPASWNVIRLRVNE